MLNLCFLLVKTRFLIHPNTLKQVQQYILNQFLLSFHLIINMNKKIFWKFTQMNSRITAWVMKFDILVFDFRFESGEHQRTFLSVPGVAIWPLIIMRRKFKCPLVAAQKGNWIGPNNRKFSSAQTYKKKRDSSSFVFKIKLGLIGLVGRVTRLWKIFRSVLLN